MFRLHPRLEADTFPVQSLALCDLRLLNDRRFPWFILVPQRPEITEVHQLSQADQQLLIQESSHVSRALQAVSGCPKINLAALGNLVPQLHWHLVARSPDDPCWPGPVWGCGTPLTYAQTAAEQLIAQMKTALERMPDYG